MSDTTNELFDFPGEEKKTLKFWKEINVFERCQKLSLGKKRYSFYDGPPFATGLPHYGHILAGTIKDIVTRYAYQTGYHVERRFGWDCHGLPVEYEIDTKFNIKSSEDVLKMGIDKYNHECRSIVNRYANEWEVIVNRLGRWIDFKNDYKTLYPTFMESVWWVFKQLFNKDLVYRGYRVMPYSTKCNTPISNFEANQNYKDVVDPSIVVAFKLLNEDNVYFVAWTTTPWTLPSNLNLIVNPDSTYLKILDRKTNRYYILMEKRLSIIYNKPEEQIKIIESFKGSKLAGMCYEPLFKYFKEYSNNGAFKVLLDGFVTEDSGTGIVHSAPGFGEDDYRVCISNKIISYDSIPPCPVDSNGCFTSIVSEFQGTYVKDADKLIIKHLKTNNQLVDQSTIRHSYPYCWRSDTPLIYKVVPSWFIRVEKLVPDLLKNNKETYWVPDFIKAKKFHNWLENARDWNVSRSRYWGTPIPIWANDDYSEIICVGSVDELFQLSGQKVSDLHRESIDHIMIPSKQSDGLLKRIPEVFDCWFESGSMPYAQMHYPFENNDIFNESFPADFIAEGVDQTRGWFYTLLVISTALFNKPPFKNLVVNGLVLSSDGQKMSKRKKNYPDPMVVVEKFGADSLRLYLINSPVVRAEFLKFQETGVRDVIREILVPWYNSVKFLLQNIELMEKTHCIHYVFNSDNSRLSSNIMDQWIHSYNQSLIYFIQKEMAGYRLYTVVPRLLKFIDQLTKYYIRFNRKRFRGDQGLQHQLISLDCLTDILISMIRLLSPFTPFIVEHYFSLLKAYLPENHVLKQLESIHFSMMPTFESDKVRVDVERSVENLQSIVEIGRILRDKHTVPLKHPLREIILINKDQQYLDDIRLLENYLLSELNIKSIIYSKDIHQYGVYEKIDVDYQSLGKKLKNDLKPVAEILKNLDYVEIEKLKEQEVIYVKNHEILLSDIKLSLSLNHDSSYFEDYACFSQGKMVVLLNIKSDDKLKDEGISREIVCRIQKLRKKVKLNPVDPITIWYSVSAMEKLNNHIKSHTNGHNHSKNIDDDVLHMKDIIKDHFNSIYDTIKQPIVDNPVVGLNKIIEDTEEIRGVNLHLIIYSGHVN